MSIRRATGADLPTILVWAAEFYEAADLPRHTPYDATTMHAIMQALIDADETLYLIAEHDGQPAGMACAVLTRPWVMPTLQMAQELFWWVDRDVRRGGIGKELRLGIEAWAVESGAQLVSMMALESSTVIGPSYERAGYLPTERHWIKEV